jgi:chromosome segregation ATPase
MSEGKKSNGHDPLTVEMVDLLKQVVSGIGRLAVQIQGTNERLDVTNAHLDTLHDDVLDVRAQVHKTNERLDHTNEQLDAICKREDTIADRVEGLPLEFHEINEKHAALETRVAKVEAAVLKPRGPRRPRARQ